MTTDEEKKKTNLRLMTVVTGSFLKRLTLNFSRTCFCTTAQVDQVAQVHLDLGMELRQQSHKEDAKQEDGDVKTENDGNDFLQVVLPFLLAGTGERRRRTNV